MLTEPLVAIVARYLGPAPGRVGDHSARSWWACPFHPDRNPSLCVEPGGTRYHCFGCGAHGDSIDFVRRLNPAMGFLEAKAAVGGEPPAGWAPLHRKELPHREPAPRPSGWLEFARRVVAEAEAALWSSAGDGARQYLNGRGLTDATIRGARLGLQAEESYVKGVFPDKPVWVPHGIFIPWFGDDDVLMVNVRRPEGSDPKYWALRGSRRDGVYPSRRLIRVGRPLALVEGEFESLLLNQDLDGLLPAITLGGAGNRPMAAVLDAMLGASPWLVAGDADAAGEKSSEGWLARSDRCRRVRPPAPWKDWTDARRDGLDLRAFWADTLAGRTPKASSATWLHPDIGQADPDMEAESAWRAEVAALPHEEWARWRRLSMEIQATLGHRPEADEIRQADHQAAAEVLASSSGTGHWRSPGVERRLEPTRTPSSYIAIGRGSRETPVTRRCTRD
jgi:hypothetical protein